MRTCRKTLNFALLPSLIEEAQTMANRMASALGDKKQLQGMHEKIQAAREELRGLKKELKEAGKVEEEKKGNSFRELFG
jgi:hypothetical protein